MQKNGEKMKKLKSIMPGTAVCAVIAADRRDKHRRLFL